MKPLSDHINESIVTESLGNKTSVLTIYEQVERRTDKALFHYSMFSDASMPKWRLTLKLEDREAFCEELEMIINSLVVLGKKYQKKSTL